jgi:hypothetical protein
MWERLPSLDNRDWEVPPTFVSAYWDICHFDVSLLLFDLIYRVDAE